MGLGADIENMSKDALEYLKRSVDGCKLCLIENLSVLIGDVICLFTLSMLFFVLFLASVTVFVILLIPFIGFPLSILAAALLLLLMALLVYVFREQLFANGVVKYLVKIFFEEKNGDGSK